ncbi:NnrU family protein [Stappia stellulata]|uniref:NnrU family protein n=1 Tax=Stappia stellulata TaxID=71235 RepID=UPI00048FE421|nr:NnrU family protein [Stappia stellulata]
MTMLIAGLIIFFGVHTLPMKPELRGRMRARLGDLGYKGAFALVSLLGLVLIVYGYGMARAAGPVLLYSPPVWMSHITMLLMLPVFVLLVAAYAPTGHIKARVKHPMILAVKVWALAHLLANGDLASVVLFGGFLAWGVVDRISLKKRGDIGGAGALRKSVAGDAISVVAGLGLYAAFVVFLHMWLIGVPVI